MYMATDSTQQADNNILDRTWKACLDFVFPPHCVACGAGGAWFCEECHAKASASAPITSHLEDSLQVTSLTWHINPLRRVVHAIKYEGARVVAPLIAQLMAEGYSTLSNSAELVVPVPLHRSRIRRRGYNQAALLAEALGAKAGLKVDTDLLERLRDTRSQVGLSKAERHANVSGAFRVTKPLAVEHILLVDDVCTSGATLRDCARALAEAGAVHVDALTLTRAGRSEIAS